MSSSTINVSLAEPLRTYVEAQVESGAYGTPADFIRELILDDRDRRRAHIEDRLEMALQEEAIEISDEEWADGDILSIGDERLSSRA
jgi:antitoxin ParD1/3/4